MAINTTGITKYKPPVSYNYCVPFHPFHCAKLQKRSLTADPEF